MDQKSELIFKSTRKDPVSGNDVPLGSTPKEVRDDIPAMLSENEYVVPADVVKYYGVKHFEDLRNKAKKGMEEIYTGESFPDSDDDFPFNDDELLVTYDEPKGMAEGGPVGWTPDSSMYTLGGVNRVGGAVQYKQYRGPNGELIVMPFFNGQPMGVIPTGYQPVHTEESGSQTTTQPVSIQEGKSDLPVESKPVSMMMPHEILEYTNKYTEGDPIALTWDEKAVAGFLGKFSQSKPETEDEQQSFFKGMLGTGLEAVKGFATKYGAEGYFLNAKIESAKELKGSLREYLDTHSQLSANDRAKIEYRIAAIDTALSKYGVKASVMPTEMAVAPQTVPITTEPPAPVSEAPSVSQPTLSFSGEASVAPEGVHPNIQMGIDFFREQGFSDEQTAGMLGNWVVESGSETLNPEAKGDSGTAFGIAQWRGDRFKNLSAYATSKGKDWTDLKTQYEFVLIEYGLGDEEAKKYSGFGSEQNAYNKLVTTTSPKTSAEFVSKYYERPGIPHLNKRVKASENIYSMLQGYKPKSYIQDGTITDKTGDFPIGVETDRTLTFGGRPTQTMKDRPGLSFGVDFPSPSKVGDAVYERGEPIQTPFEGDKYLGTPASDREGLMDFSVGTQTDYTPPTKVDVYGPSYNPSWEGLGEAGTDWGAWFNKGGLVQRPKKEKRK